MFTLSIYPQCWTFQETNIKQSKIYIYVLTHDLTLSQCVAGRRLISLSKFQRLSSSRLLDFRSSIWSVLHIWNKPKMSHERNREIRKTKLVSPRAGHVSGINKHPSEHPRHAWKSGSGYEWVWCSFRAWSTTEWLQRNFSFSHGRS